MVDRTHSEKLKFYVLKKVVFEGVSGKPLKVLTSRLIITHPDSPRCLILNSENPTSLARIVPELFKMQPTAFFFEMDSSKIK